MKGIRVWFRWSNGKVQRVWIYRAFINTSGEHCFRGRHSKMNFVLKANDCGRTWAFKKEDLQMNEDAKYYETIKEFIARRFPEEDFAIYQIKDGVTFQQARDSRCLRKAVCAGSTMDTALREKVWIGFHECFGFDKKELEQEYFKGVKPLKVKLPKVLRANKGAN